MPYIAAKKRVRTGRLNFDRHVSGAVTGCWMKADARQVLAAFGADCTLPLAAWAREEGGRLRLSGLLATPDGLHVARGDAFGDTPEEAAEACVAAMRADGADEVLARIGK